MGWRPSSNGSFLLRLSRNAEFRMTATEPALGTSAPTTGLTQIPPAPGGTGRCSASAPLAGRLGNRGAGLRIPEGDCHPVFPGALPLQGADRTERGQRGGIYQLVKGFQAVLGQQVAVGELAAAELHPDQGVSMGQQAEAVQVLEGDGLPGRQGVAQRHGDAEAVVQIRPYPRCKTSTP